LPRISDLVSNDTGHGCHMTLKSVWQAYLDIYVGLNVAVERVRAEDVPTIQFRQQRSRVNRKIVVINSGRVDDQGLLASAVRAKDAITGQDQEPAEMVFVDAAIRRRSLVGSGMRALAITASLRYPITLFRHTIQHSSFACGVIEVFRCWLRAQDVVALDLFTSNSRFIEMLRLAAVIEGLEVTEFLHGVSVEQFGTYYEILERLAVRSGARSIYVNMLPGLPQPPAVERRLLKWKGAEVFFRNERAWAAPADTCFDALIVGSGILEGDYVESSYFQADIEAIRECQMHGLKVIYCPHPLERERTLPWLPTGALVGSVAEHIESARVVIGHFSTVILNAKLLGFHVLVFPGAWDRLPANQAALFPDRQAGTYSIGHMLNMLREMGPDLPDRNLDVSGHDLIKKSHSKEFHDGQE
jgi:hypothetical protein